MAYKDGLKAYSTIIRNAARDTLHAPSSWAYRRVWDMSFWFDDRHNDAVSYFRNLGLGPLDIWPDAGNWIRDRLVDGANFLYDHVRGARDYPIVFFNERWSDERGTWWWVYFAYDSLWWLETLAETIGDWIDHAPEAIYTVTFNAFNWLLDYPGFSLGSIARLISGTASNYWDYAKSNSGNNYEALGKTFEYFGAVLQLRLNDLRSWAEQQGLRAVDWVGWGTAEFQRVLAGSNFNQWTIVKQQNSDIVTAYGALWSNIGDTIHNRFTDTISSLQYYTTQAVNSVRQEFTEWAGTVQPYFNWIDDVKNTVSQIHENPTGFVWGIIEEQFKLRIEPLLIRWWDGG